MMDMQDVPQQVYFELVHKLLNCWPGEELTLLATRPELVNKQLVEALLAKARILREQDGPAAEPTVLVLVGWAQNLAQQLGLELGGDDPNKQVRFLMQVLQSIEDSKGNPAVVYPLWQQNLALLDDSMIVVLKAWVHSTFGEVEPALQKSIAMTIHNLGDLIQQFSLGNKAVNMELSIACYAIALDIFTVKENAYIWGVIQNSLGIAYRNRIRGDNAQNLEKAIASYASALEIRTRQNLPIQWAATQNNLANAYLKRVMGDRSQNLEQAIASYTSALEIRTRQNLPIQWAATQNNLANAYLNRVMGDQAQNLEKAIASYVSALEIRTRQILPIQWAITYSNLANAYLNRVMGDQARNLEQAIAGYSATLEIFTPAAIPIYCLKSARQLGDIYFEQEHWPQAIAAYEIAMQAAEILHCWSVDDLERQHVQQTTASIYENARQSAVNLNNEQQAIAYTKRFQAVGGDFRVTQ
jgi:tetratricopeptide (TPR) repeat protein